MKALLLIDIQNQIQDDLHKDFINNSFVKNVVQLIRYADSQNIPVIHITTEYTEENTPTLNWQKGFNFFKEGTYASEEIEEIAKTFKEGHYKIVKHHYDSFWNTNLDQLLKELDVDDLIIAGAYTHWCVLSTIFSAMSRDLNQTIVTDCVGSRYPELDKLIFGNVLDKKVPALQIKTLSELING